MALAPLRSSSGPHTVRADRLAFTTPVPVREASAAGHWVTVGHHGEDDEGGGVHIFISSGGVVEKGPRGLLGHHIGAAASHPGAGKTKHHPVGHEPPGARDHPHYAEAPPHAERPTPALNAGQEAAKRPGKPYARLSGAEQGTRHEQIGKALGEAQSAARGAKAAKGQDTGPEAVKPLEGKAPGEAAAKKGSFGERREAAVKAMQDKAQRERATYRVLGTSDDQTTCEICGKKDLKKTVALHHDQSGEVVRAGSDCAAELLKTSRGSIEKAAQQHGEKREAAIEKALESHPNQEIIKRFAGRIDAINRYHRAAKTTPSETEQASQAHARQRMAELTAQARRDIEKQLPPDKPLPDAQAGASSPGATKPFSAPQQPPEEKIAAAAVAHQQAQADLAAHRAKADRNPNPWAPHLSPPVGDATDKELAEKATRAQLAHQAAQAQQQGQAQAEQQEGQRAHEKEMVRLKQAGGERREAGEGPARPPLAHEHQPGDAPELYKARNELIEAQHRWTRAKVEARTPAEHERVKLHQEMVRRLTGQVRDLEAKGQPAQPPQSEQPKKPAQAAYEALQAEVKRRQGERPAEPTPRFSAPQAQETPQTAPQPEQPAHPYEGEAHEHVAALPQAVRDTLTKAGVKVQQHQGPQAQALPGHSLSTPMAKLGPADAGYDSRTGVAHFFGAKAQRYDVHHEMGHALDDALGYQTTGKHHTPYSSQPQFQALYHKHKENMDLPPPMRHSASEMFADAFAMHHDVLHQEGETADGEPRMVHRGRKLERAAPDLRAHIAALSEHPPGRKVRESASPAPRFSAPVAPAR